MKRLVYVILILVFLVIGFIVFEAFALMSIDEVKSIEIKAGQKDVFSLVSSQNDYHRWSPYLYNDTMLIYDVRNENGAVGNQLHWSRGAKGEDLGYQEVDSIDAPSLVILKCYVEKPFSARSTFEYTFTPIADQSVVVKQRFIMKSSFVSAFFMFISGAKGAIDNSNSLALDLLKKESERTSLEVQ